MPEDLLPLDISESDELRRLVAEVRESHRARVLQIDRHDVAILTPVESHVTRTRFGKPTDADDTFWNIVGIAHGNGPGDVSERVDDYLAEAYASTIE